MGSARGMAIAKATSVPLFGCYSMQLRDNDLGRIVKDVVKTERDRKTP